MHFLVLIIRARRHLHLISQLLVGSWIYHSVLKLSVILEDLIAVQNFVKNFIVGPWMLEEWIVHVTASCRINSYVVAFPLILKQCLTDILLVLEICRLLEWLQNWGELLWVLIDNPINMLLDHMA